MGVGQRVYVDAHVRLVQGRKVGKSVYVVPVRVADEEVDFLLAPFHETFAQRVNTRACVNDHARVPCVDFDAGRIAAVSSAVWRGDGKGSPDTPKRDLHVSPTGHCIQRSSSWN